jgi:hypothetical protein
MQTSEQNYPFTEEEPTPHTQGAAMIPLEHRAFLGRQHERIVQAGSRLGQMRAQYLLAEAELMKEIAQAQQFMQDEAGAVARNLGIDMADPEEQWTYLPDQFMFVRKGSPRTE